MTGKIMIVSVILLSLVASSLLVVNGDRGCEKLEQDLENCTKKFEGYQLQTIEALTQIFDEEQMCPPCTCTRLAKQVKDGQLKRVRLETEINEGREQRLRLETEINEGREQRLRLETAINEGREQRLSLETEINEGREQRLSLETEINEGREQRLRLETEINEGREQRLRLEMEINNERANAVLLDAKYDAAIAAYEPRIYFATWKDGLKRFSLATSEVKTVAGYDGEGLFGVAYDWVRAKVYWCGFFSVFRANEKGTGQETVLDTRKYGTLMALAFDWISTNIYVASRDGLILACDGRPTMSFNCATVLTGQGWIYGVALDPIEGTMYWTVAIEDVIKKARMDGFNPVTLAATARAPVGIAIDFGSRRVYWTTYGANKIESIDLDRTRSRRTSEVQLVVQRPDGSDTWGIAVYGDRIYWSTQGSNLLESSTKDGSDVRVHHTENKDIYHIAAVPNLNSPLGRMNHCQGHNCSQVCVLTATSFRCIE